jgi:hypothetical protein
MKTYDLEDVLTYCTEVCMDGHVLGSSERDFKTKTGW